VSRRSQPGFGQLNRRIEAGPLLPRRPNARTPLAKPRDQPGVLWDAFREKQEPAG
jgi:hypothetical protein